MLAYLARLEREHYAPVPDPDDPAQRVNYATRERLPRHPRRE
jgi:hypothetical protein